MQYFGMDYLENVSGLCIVYLALFLHMADTASIAWSSTADGKSILSNPGDVWYFQASNRQATEHRSRRPAGPEIFASDRIVKCQEPSNLPEQFMQWFHESTSDPNMLSYTAPAAATPGSQRTGADALMAESEKCTDTPSTDPDASTMDRALCPWEWRLNRDESREPKLISEARCLCRQSRGRMASIADCVPIKRDFPVLKRVFCDENGSYQYVKSYETITVGCHSVMPRIIRALSMQWLMQRRET